MSGSSSSSSSSSSPSSAPSAAAIIEASSSFLSALDSLLETADSDDAEAVQEALSEGLESNGTDTSASSAIISRRLALLRSEPEAEPHCASLQDELHAALSSLHQSRLQQAQLRQRLQLALLQQQQQAVSSPPLPSSTSLQSLSRSELEAALSSARASHDRQLSDVQQRHAEELQHTVQYKLRFAQASSRLDDLELQLEAERSRTRKSRAVVEKCQQAQRRLEAQEAQLATTVAKLAQQLITAGIPVKGMDLQQLQPSRSPQASAASHTPPPALPLPATASSSSASAVSVLPAALQPKGGDAAAAVSFSAAELDLMRQLMQDDDGGKQQQPLASPPHGQRLPAGLSQSPPPRPAAGASPSRSSWFSSMFSSKQAPSSHAANAQTQLPTGPVPAAASQQQPLTAAAAAPH